LIDAPALLASGAAAKWDDLNATRLTILFDTSWRIDLVDRSSWFDLRDAAAVPDPKRHAG
jgi:hypothetical protein